MRLRNVGLVVMGLIVLSAALMPTCHAADRPPLVFVDNRGGDDRAAGTSPIKGLDSTGPTETVQAALRRVNPSGDVILLPADAPIREEAVVDGRRVRGYPWRSLVIEGNGLTWAGQPERPLPPNLQPPVDISWLQAPITLAERLEEGVPFGSLVVGHPIKIAGHSGNASASNGGPCSAVGGSVAGTSETADHYPTLGWNHRAAERNPFAFERELREYVIETRRLRYALIIDRANYVVVRNVRFKGFSLDAVQVRGPAEGVVFENCSFSDCGRAGVLTQTNAKVEFRNCSFENNGNAAILCANVSRVTLARCAVAAKPKGVHVDESSELTDLGGAFAPLEAGPFVVPPQFRTRHADAKGPPTASTEFAPQPAGKPAKPAAGKEAPTEPPKPKAKKSFFEE